MNLQISKILYATDLTKNSLYALTFAIGLARTHHARIVILHAIEPRPSVIGMYGADDTIHENQESEVQYKKEMELSEETIKAGIDLVCKKIEKRNGAPYSSLVSVVSKILTPVGYPVEEILVKADDEECDVIVIGAHGKGFLKNTFLGNVAHAVLDRARKPVVVVPWPPSGGQVDL